MNDQLDAVAQAIWTEDGKTDETESGRWWNVAWEELTAAEQSFYARLARAAIDALGLTEEWRCIGWVSTSTEKTAWLQRQSNGGEVQARLVSPWVRKDSSDE